MSKRFPLERWTLPDVVEPSDSICYIVPVPNDKFHVAAFMGAIYALTWSKNWARDDAHTAADVCRVWQTIFDNLEKCPVQVQFRQNDICTLQASFDDGDTWVTIFDTSTCVINGVNDGIQQRLDDGTLSGGGQQPGQGPGTPGTCYEYDLTLRGNTRWISPVAVEAGDIITVSGTQGAWWDGDITHNWQCGDGSEYFLGECSGVGGYTQGTDPAPAVNHMGLVGNLPADTTTPFFDMFDTAYTVPAGVALGDFFLLPNDDVWSDNQGSINFHVQICKSLWTSVLDFRVSDYNLIITIFAGAWVATQGIVGANFGILNQSDATIKLDVGSFQIYDAVLLFSRPSASGANGIGRMATLALPSTYTTYGANFTDTGTDISYSHQELKSIDGFYIDLNSGSSAGPSTIVQLTLRGTGIKPSGLP